jgi:hypothetical protein
MAILVLHYQLRKSQNKKALHRFNSVRLFIYRAVKWSGSEDLNLRLVALCLPAGTAASHL